MLSNFVKNVLWPEECTFREQEDFRRDDTRFFPTSKTVHNLIKEAGAQTRLDAKDQRSTLLTLATKSNTASWVMRPAQAGALTYTCSPGDGLRARVLSTNGDFTQTPPLCSAFSEDLMLHVNTLLDVTTVTSCSRNPPSDMPNKRAKT
eukprot:6768280-Pyramimonas_sp.AAC.1